MNYHEVISSGLDEMNLPWNEGQVDQLARYCREVELWNPRYNLVRASGIDFVHRHVFDALSALPVLLQDTTGEYLSIADIGSGNGIPGIPLAVMIPQSTMTLVERSAKRSGFLRNAAAVCGLYPQVQVFEGDVREVTQRFSRITFRAVSSLPAILPFLLPLLEPGGRIGAYKGTKEQVSWELISSGLEKERFKVWDLTNPFLPDHQRQLAVIQGD